MNNAILPFSFGIHLTFAVFGAVFFFLQFARLKYKYHLIMGIALPLSLLIHVAENKTFFYAIGIAEVILLLLCAVNISVERRKLASMHTIRETMQKINIADDVTPPAPEKTVQKGFSEEPAAEKPEEFNTWLDNLLEQADIKQPEEDPKEEKPRELKTGWVDFNINDD
jgi:hypothetical protein